VVNVVGHGITIDVVNRSRDGIMEGATMDIVPKVALQAHDLGIGVGLLVGDCIIPLFLVAWSVHRTIRQAIDDVDW